MRTSVCLFSLCVAFSGVGVLFATEAISSPTSFDSDTSQVIARGDAVTLLRFETQHYLVRVFRQEEQIYLNVYNKETGFTDVNRVPAVLAPPENENDKWRTYVNQRGDLEYRARVNPEGKTELEIRLPGSAPTQPEAGFNATYSFPHIFLGEDLEATLSELEDAGWVIDSTESETVELTQNQLALDIKFDAQTQVITYTRLIDSTQGDRLATHRR